MRGPRAATLRVVIADDSPMALASICNLLAENPNIGIVGTALDGHQAFELVKQSQPDLVLMDVQMPSMNGIDATRLLKQQLPATEVILFSIHDSPELRSLCREAGARAFVPKKDLNHELGTIIEAIKTELQGS